MMDVDNQIAENISVPAAVSVAEFVSVEAVVLVMAVVSASEFAFVEVVVLVVAVVLALP